MRVLIGTLCFTVCVFGHVLCEEPTATTRAGTFIGTSETVTVGIKSITLNKYLGIPFAQPPVGTLRFKKPEPLDKLESPYTADRFRPACRQIAIPNMSTPGSQSEDCLFLNVYVPDQPADESGGHAVMVFIHGGAYVVGSGENYHGENLATYGNVIVVTVNYRLGILGFFGTGDAEAPGNLGFWDQRMALQWVHDNIGGFGGDSSRVTIFGESAGGTATLYQSLYPGNKGLFQRAVSQSGAPNANTAVNSDVSVVFEFVLEQFNCVRDGIAEAIECLQEMELEDIMKILNDLMQHPDNITKLRFYPLVDGDFIKVHPGSLSRLSQITNLDQITFYRSIDTMIGCNSQEGAMFVAVPFTVPIEDPLTFSPTREEFETQILSILIGLEFGPDALPLLRSLFISEYTDWSNPDSLNSVRQKFLDVWGDVIFNVAAVEMSMLHANSTGTGNTFFYHLQATPTTPILRKMDWLKGANHADELGFVFGFNADVMAANQSYSAPLPWEYDLSYRMMTYWSNFAKSGDPNKPQPVDLDLPTWPTYDVNNKRHINLDIDISVGHNLFAKRVYFWLNVIPDVMNALAEKQQTLNDEIDGFCSADGTCD